MARRIKTRDYSMLQIITGATKAGVHRDNPKHASATACRGEKKMFAARKNPRYDLQMEWTRDAEHGGVEVFDVYGARLPQGGWSIVRMDIIDEDGNPVTFNTMSLSEEERLAIENALQDENDGLGIVRH
jgi:hypothetical protein